MPTTLSRLFIVGLITLAAACGGAHDGSGGSPTQPPIVTPGVPTVASVAVAGADAVEIGKTIQLTAQARDTNGAAITGKAFIWSSASDAIASVGSDGTVTGRAAGTTQISARVDGKTGSRSVTVATSAVVNAVASVAITGLTTLETEGSATLSARVKDASGAVLSGVPTTWSSSDPTLISVSGDGTITGLRIGTATISVKAGSATASTTVTSALLPFTFLFSGTATPTDQQFVKDAVQQGQHYFVAAFGRGLQTSTVITGAIVDPGCDTHTGNGAFSLAAQVTICTANSGWANSGPIQKQRIVIHELFHALQYETHWLGNTATAGPDWIVEGGAELVAFRALADKGLLPLATARGCQLQLVASFTRNTATALPPLNQLESHTAWLAATGPTTSLAFLGVDELTTSGIAALGAYGAAIAAGGSAATAFQSAFGQSIASFYAQFAAYEQSLTVPASYACGL